MSPNPGKPEFPAIEWPFRRLTERTARAIIRQVVGLMFCLIYFATFYWWLGAPGWAAVGFAILLARMGEIGD